MTKLFIVGEINPFTEMPVGEWSLPDGVSSIRFRADAMRTVWCPVLLIAAKHSKLPVYLCVYSGLTRMCDVYILMCVSFFCGDGSHALRTANMVLLRALQ